MAARPLSLAVFFALVDPHIANAAYFDMKMVLDAYFHIKV